MKLTKEEMALLRENRTAFLVKAYLACDSTPTTRECAELLGLSHTTCFRLMKRFGFGKNETPNETVFETKKTRRIKGSKPVGETPNETAFETKKHSKTQSPLTQYKEVFNEFYRQLSDGIDFYWEAKEIKALDFLTKKIAAGMKEKGLSPTEETLTNNFRLLLSIISDPWILDNFTPTIINSKYNAIITTYRRSKLPATPAPAVGIPIETSDEKRQKLLERMERNVIRTPQTEEQ